MEDEETTVVVTGELIDISSRFWSEGWGFGKIKSKEHAEPVRVTGILEGLRLGVFVTAKGRFVEGRYGRELKAESVVENEPEGSEGLRRWLVERVPQIGPQRAQLIADAFGERAWEVFENAPEELEEIPGLTPERIEKIVKAWTEYKTERERYVAYYDLGLTQREARAAEKVELFADAIRKSPFTLYFYDIANFRRTEALYDRYTGVVDPLRPAAAIVEAIRELAQDGHTAAEEDDVLEYARATIGISWSILENALRALIENGRVVRYKDVLMLEAYAKAEEAIANKINDLLKVPNDTTRSDAGRGGSDASDPESGDRDWRSGDRQDYDRSGVSGSDF